jgi:hypothetical protein
VRVHVNPVAPEEQTALCRVVTFIHIYITKCERTAITLNCPNLQRMQCGSTADVYIYLELHYWNRKTFEQKKKLSTC